MKKCLAFILLLFVFASSKAIPLFPFFTDLAGDYKDGIPAEWAALKIKCMYSRTSPFFYSNMEGAEAFLKDVLPVSTEKIVRSETKLKDGTLIVKYESPLSDGGVSTLYLVEIPNKPFAVGYNETKKAQQTAQCFCRYFKKNCFERTTITERKYCQSEKAVAEEIEKGDIEISFAFSRCFGTDAWPKCL